MTRQLVRHPFHSLKRCSNECSESIRKGVGWGDSEGGWGWPEPILLCVCQSGWRRGVKVSKRMMAHVKTPDWNSGGGCRWNLIKDGGIGITLQRELSYKMFDWSWEVQPMLRREREREWMSRIYNKRQVYIFTFKR
ncbi:hypothetical protein CEXT_196241 [Caerostris extrusa]|uniref:Uncharacterized protein n=1 Tax=Caerostris extrusa TaxID=172846 RepID=A0AAV4VKR0_CAEEX|nr:hypothetical protein CEXT_196241 [Caerostris extrusa]